MLAIESISLITSLFQDFLDQKDIYVTDCAFFFFPSQLRMFYLIEFAINKTVAVVPQNWYQDGVTYWPNYKSDERVDKAVKNAEEPRPDWNTFNARVVKSCGTL